MKTSWSRPAARSASSRSTGRKALNALCAALIRELGAGARRVRGRRRDRRVVVTGSEKAFAAGADIKEMAEQELYVDVYPRRFHHQRLGAHHHLPQADRRRGRGLRAGRRLRGRDDVRHHHRRRNRQIRPARDHARHHSRRRRHAAPDALRRQGEGDGHGADRPHDGRGRGRAQRPRQPRRADGQADRGGDEDRGEDRGACRGRRR